jgi:tryptophanyl-tRNA synthetase
MSNKSVSENNAKPVVMSGIRPTGFLHLGNYFGAVRNYVKMQYAYDCYFMVADWHALTTHPDTASLKENIQRVFAENIACGLEPDKVAFFCQSHIPEIAELYLLLNSLAYVGELEKTPTFKDKVRLNPNNVNAGLLTYPVLMAADILIHRATYVPVGKDQEQHLEIARDYVHRFNTRYESVFPQPKAFNFNEELIKVPSLDGAGKMSKSENQYATLYLSDDDATIRKKVMRAKTDSGPAAPNSPLTPDIQNLFFLLSLVRPASILEQFEQAYSDCSIKYGELKKEIAEGMVELIAPIREKALSIQSDKIFLEKVMKEGAEKARNSASETIKQVKRAMKMNYFT